MSRVYKTQVETTYFLFDKLFINSYLVTYPYIVLFEQKCMQIPFLKVRGVHVESIVGIQKKL